MIASRRLLLRAAGSAAGSTAGSVPPGGCPGGGRRLRLRARRSFGAGGTAPPSAPVASSSSVSEAEVAHFSRMASTWWDADSNPLIGMNPLRVGYIRDALLGQGRRGKEEEGRRGEELPHKFSTSSAARPLEGLRILDVGCGGGLLSESLSRLGAAVTAIDPSAAVAEVARRHSSHDVATRTIDYRGGTSVEDLAEEVLCQGMGDGVGGDDDPRFDAVCVLEVVEHATDPAGLLRSAARLVRPGGILFVSTVNRTAKSYGLTILAAEHLLRMVPVGTHTWSQYLGPAEVGQMVTGGSAVAAAAADEEKSSGMEVLDVCGMVIDPPFFTMRWRLDRNDLGVNWIGAYRKKIE